MGARHKKAEATWDEPDGREYSLDCIDDWFPSDSVEAYRQAWARVRPPRDRTTKRPGGDRP